MALTQSPPYPALTGGATAQHAVANQGYVVSAADGSYLGPDYFLARPHLWEQFYQSYDLRGILTKLIVAGKKEAVKSSAFWHYQYGLPYRSFLIGAYVSTGSTASAAKFTLASASFVGPSGATRAPLKVGDVFRLPNGEDVRVGAISTDAAPNTVYTVYRETASSVDLRTALALYDDTDAVPLAVIYNVHAEGSSTPAMGMQNEPTRYEGAFSIIRHQRTVTGSAAGNIMQIPFEGSNKWFYKNQFELSVEHQLESGLELLIGRGKSFGSPDGTINAAASFESLVDKHGGVYTTSSVALADFDAVCDLIKTEMGPTSYLAQSGSDLHSAISNLFRTDTSLQYGIDRSNFGGGDAKGKMVDLGLNSFAKNGITFNLQEEPCFNLKQKTALATYGYKKKAFLIPDGTERVTTYDNGVAKKVTVPNLTLMYKEDETGASRYMKTWQRGIQQDGVDRTVLETLSEIGLRGVGMEKFIKFTLTS